MSFPTVPRSATPVPDAHPWPDPYMPDQGTDAFRVELYELDLDYRLASNKLTARAVLHASAQRASSAIVLDFTGLRVVKVLVDGGKVAKFSQRAEQLVIVPVQPLAGDENFTLDIRYEGNPAPRRGLWGEVGWEELTDGVLVAGQPNGAPSWFPCNDHPSHKSRFRISVTTDSHYRAVSNGRLVAHSRKSSRETWTYEQVEPMATYLATVQIGRYELIPLVAPAHDAGRTPVHSADHAAETRHPDLQDPVVQNVAVSPELSGPAREGLARQADMMRTFVRCFGPYPFPEYTVVVADDDLEIPLEAQSLSILGRNHLSQDWESQRLIAHELAHQWFGNSLTVASWRDIWLHEGFACFAEWIWSEESGGPTISERAYGAWRKLNSGAQDLIIGDPGPELMFDDRVYKRGALALYALQVLSGDVAFFSLIHEWTRTRAHGSVSTADFILAADRATGLDCEQLLHPWLLEEKLPPFPRN